MWSDSILVSYIRHLRRGKGHMVTTVQRNVVVSGSHAIATLPHARLLTILDRFWSLINYKALPGGSLSRSLTCKTSVNIWSIQIVSVSGSLHQNRFFYNNSTQYEDKKILNESSVLIQFFKKNMFVKDVQSKRNKHKMNSDGSN